MNDAKLVDLEQFALLACEGPQATTFLQGQLTTHLNEITQTQSRLGCCCDQKGRVYATFRLIKQDNDFYLLSIPRDVLDHCLAELKKFAVFSKVTLSNASDQFQQLGLIGEQASGILQNLLKVYPREPNEVVKHLGLTLVNVSGQQPRFLIIASAIDMKAFKESLLAVLKSTTPETWDFANIIDGIASITKESLGLYTPHDLNYHLINGVSFTKGCYRGQEIVARMHYLGKLKQNLYRAKIITNTKPLLGSELIDDNQQVVGHIINCVQDSEQDWQVLAVIRSEAKNKDRVYLANQAIKLEFLPLPYSTEGNSP